MCNSDSYGRWAMQRARIQRKGLLFDRVMLIVRRILSHVSYEAVTTCTQAHTYALWYTGRLIDHHHMLAKRKVYQLYVHNVILTRSGLPISRNIYIHTCILPSTNIEVGSWEFKVDMHVAALFAHTYIHTSMPPYLHTYTHTLYVVQLTKDWNVLRLGNLEHTHRYTTTKEVTTYSYLHRLVHAQTYH